MYVGRVSVHEQVYVHIHVCKHSATHINLPRQVYRRSKAVSSVFHTTSSYVHGCMCMRICVYTRTYTHTHILIPLWHSAAQQNVAPHSKQSLSVPEDMSCPTFSNLATLSSKQLPISYLAWAHTQFSFSGTMALAARNLARASTNRS
jgi:hypothetical protein